MISELMVDPKAVSDADGEWFEVHNPGADALNLQGCEVGDGGATGSGSRMLVDEVPVPAGGFVAVARSDAAGFEAATVASFSLKNGADVIEIVCEGVVIDRVEYDKALGFPVAPGIAMSLDARNPNADDNDSPSAWCAARTPYATDLGTPGAPNPRCRSDDDAGTKD